MYNYEWDPETGGYLLNTNITGVIKEVRPVFKEELRLLGFDEQFNWQIPDTDLPLMWAEGRRYIYKGNYIGEANGGGLYEKPTLKSIKNDLIIDPVNISTMIKKNKELMEGIVQKTLKFIYTTFLNYKNKVDLTYIAFSGGKDSVVVLDLIQRALPNDEFYIIFGDTTMELVETLAIVNIAENRWNNLNWQIAKAPIDALESWDKIGYPARKLRWCCSVHKTAPSVNLAVSLARQKLNTKGISLSKVTIMAFDGIRAEESNSRASYSIISSSKKHEVQINCSPILEWNTCELFLYIFENNLPLNNLYLLGSSRVGCVLCPMASNWYEFVINNSFSEEVSPFIEIIDRNLVRDFSSEEDKKKYYQDGGWKSRVGGRELLFGENKITEITSNNIIKILIKNGNLKWDAWLPSIGNLIFIGNDEYIIEYKDMSLRFHVYEECETTIIQFTPLVRSKVTIRLMYLFKNALYKSAYCIGCKSCMAECKYGAVIINSEGVTIENCVHCEACLDMEKGCIVAKSLSITGIGNNMSKKNISRYQNFGYRKEWLSLFFELRDEFWSNKRMGKYMVIGFRRWLKESGITEDNSITVLGRKLCSLGIESLSTWGIIFTNLSYSSPIIKWYTTNIKFHQEYMIDDLIIMLGDNYSITTKKNALTSLKETLKTSPIGTLLGQGECNMKGKAITSIIRLGWSNPEPLVILYSLFKFAEASDRYYNFTLTNLFEETTNENGISPAKLFNISREDLQTILYQLALDHRDFIKVVFNKDLENIYLNSEKTSLDVVELF